MISRNYTYAFLAGVAAGAATAALYAPQSGADTRQRLRQGIEDAGNSLGEASQYLRGHADRLDAEAQATLAHTQSQVQQVLDQARTALNTTLEQAGGAFAANAGQASGAIRTLLDVATGQPPK